MGAEIGQGARPRFPRPYGARGPRRTGMNTLEAAYAAHLELLRRCGEVRAYVYEGVKIRLAGKTWYTPDFCVITNEHIELVECKGHWEDDARVKIKVAAEIWGEAFRFLAVKRERGQWTMEEFNRRVDVQQGHSDR